MFPNHAHSLEQRKSNPLNVEGLEVPEYRVDTLETREGFFCNMVSVRGKIYKSWLKNADYRNGELDRVKRNQKRSFEELYDLENDPFIKHKS